VTIAPPGTELPAPAAPNDASTAPTEGASGDPLATAVGPTARPRSGLTRIAGPVIFAVSVVAAGVVLWRQGSLDEVGEAVRGADPAAIAAGLLLYVFGLALLCLRWHALVVMAKGTSDLAKATEVFLISVSVNYVAPLKLAIPMRAAMTKRALGLDATETGAVVLWEGTADVGVLAVATVVWLLVTGDALDDVLDAVGGAAPVYAALIVAVGLSAGLCWLLLKRRPVLRARLSAALVRALRYPRTRPVPAGVALGLTVLYWTTQAGVLWILLDALDAGPSAGLVLGMVSLPILFGMLSPGPGGAGVREALMVAVAGAYGADAALALVAAVAYRVALFAAIPIIYLIAKGWIAFRSGRARVGAEC
jgi:uncharacterized membrane protein YbhN (UPF0104 family)